MTQQEKLDGLAEIFEVDSAVLTPETPLESLAWDSMAMLSVIAFVNEKTGRRVTGAQVKAFKTIGDILVVAE